MDWRKINLPPSAADSPEPSLWIYDLTKIYSENDKPQDFCVYLTVEQSTRNRTIYFSPVAVKFCDQFFSSVAHAHKVYECDAPVGGTPLVGDTNSLDCLRLLNRSS